MIVMNRRSLAPAAKIRFRLALAPGIRRRLAFAAAIAWLVAQLAAAAPTLAPWPDALFVADFGQFWTAAWIVRDGAGPELFDINVQATYMQKLELESATTEIGRSLGFRNPYFYPPPLALLFVPFTLLPLAWAYLLWSGVSLLAFVTAIALHLRGRSGGYLLAAALLSYLGVVMTLREGQVNGLLTLFLSLSMLALARGRPALGGALMGLILLKPQFALIFPVVFLAKGRWRELAGMGATGLALAAISLVVLGPAGVVRYLELLRSVGGFYPSPPTMAEAMVNWRALLAALMPGVPAEAGSAMMVMVGTLTVLLSLVAWSGRWDPASPRFPLQMLATVLATLIATPHSHFYGTVLALAPAAMMLGRPMAGVPALWGRIILGLSYLLPLVVYLVWPAPRWLLAPYFLLAVLVLIACVRSPALGQRSHHPRSTQGAAAAIPGLRYGGTEVPILTRRTNRRTRRY